MKIRYLIWFFAVVFLYFYLSIFKNALIDDAFITMSYVRTLLRSGTWGFFPGYITNTATSPLNVILLTLIGLFIGPTTEVPILLALISLILIAVTLTRISILLFSTEIFGYLATLTFVFNPLLISTLGLESILFAALFVIAIYCYLTQKWYLLAIVLGLLTTTRTEGVLFFVVILIFVPSKKLRFRFVILYFLCVAPWYIFSWVYLGSFIPDTIFIKTDQASWGGWNFSNGVILFYRKYPLETILSFAFLPLILFYFNKQVRKSSILLILFLLGLVHFVGYSLLQVPPYQWYYIPQVATIILLGSLSMGFVYQSYHSQSWQRKIMQGIMLICLLVPSLGMFHLLARDNFSVKEMPIHTNWATHEQYREVGLWLKERNTGETVLLSGEIGTLAYYCDCYLLDCFSDRRWLRDFIVRHTNGGGIRPTLYRINFLFFVDNPEFSPYSYRLSGYKNRENIDKNVHKWETSTKWIPQGLITINKP